MTKKELIDDIKRQMQSISQMIDDDDLDEILVWVYMSASTLDEDAYKLLNGHYSEED